MIRLSDSRVPILAALLVTLGCAGSTPPPEGLLATAAPVVDDAPLEGGMVEDAPVEVREPDLPSRLRWESPFAVSAAGRVEPLEARRVDIVGTDPTIAEGLAEQRAIAARVLNRGASQGGREVAATPARERTVDPADRERTAPSAVEPDRVSEARGARAVQGASGSAPATRLHRVERGDTWIAIARRYGIATADLQSANPGVDPNRIQAGQNLIIPLRVD